MLSEKVASMLNEQIAKELFSAYLYLGFANYYNNVGLSGFENWFYIQAQEERDHAMLFRDFLHHNGHKVTLLPLDAPQSACSSFDAPLRKSLIHEKNVTSSIKAIYQEAVAQSDYNSMQFLNWFIKEQSEEEKSTDDLIKKYELFAKDGSGLHVLDKELAERIYSPPTFTLN